MRFEYINPFAEASFEILSTYLEDEMRTSDILLRDGSDEISGVAAIIELNGCVQGSVMIDMTEETACKVASIMNETELFNYNDLVQHTVKELANQVSGLAVTKLEKLGFDIGVSPPEVARGTRIDNKYFLNESLHVKLETSVGNIGILVAIEEKN